MRLRQAAAAALALGAVASCSSGHVAVATTPASTPQSSQSSQSAPPATAPHRLQVSTLLRLPVGVSRAVAVGSGGRLLVLGGLAPGDASTARVWSIDVRARKAHPAGHLALAVHDASGAVLGGHVFVFGGGAATTVATVQEYAGGTTHVVGSLPRPRSDSAAAVVGHTAYVVGGFDGHGMTRDVLATTDGRHFRVAARLVVGVRYPAVATLGRYLLVVGGALATTEGTASGPQTTAVQRIDTATGKTTVVAHLARPLAHATGVDAGGVPLVAGGRHATVAVRTVGTVPVPGVQVVSARLPASMSDASAAELDGVGYLVGGETSGPAAPVSTVLAVRVA